METEHPPLWRSPAEEEVIRGFCSLGRARLAMRGPRPPPLSPPRLPSRIGRESRERGREDGRVEREKGWIRNTATVNESEANEE